VHLQTPRGVRTSVFALATSVLMASGLALAAPGWADTSTPPVSIPPVSIPPESMPPASTTAAPATSTTLGAALRSVLVRPSAKLTAARITSTPGAKVRLAGKIVVPSGVSVAGLQVVLQERRAKIWTTAVSTRLSAAGTTSFTISPQKTVELRMRYEGSPLIASANSPGLTITVKRSTVATTRSTVATTQSAVATTQAAVNSMVAAKLAKVLATAKAQTGDRYVFGAAGPNTFDCSGLTQYAYKSIGITLPHQANSQKTHGRAISRSQARPGDLIIFLSGGYGYHAAIYAGNGYMYDAPRAGSTVGKHKIWSSNIVFRRLV
jgi:cell wall-associated NlpC family hydrolase